MIGDINPTPKAAKIWSGIVRSYATKVAERKNINPDWFSSDLRRIADLLEDLAAKLPPPLTPPMDAP